MLSFSSSWIFSSSESSNLKALFDIEFLRFFQSCWYASVNMNDFNNFLLWFRCRRRWKSFLSVTAKWTEYLQCDMFGLGRAWKVSMYQKLFGQGLGCRKLIYHRSLVSVNNFIHQKFRVFKKQRKKEGCMWIYVSVIS